jgi:hypothetical protein
MAGADMIGSPSDRRDFIRTVPVLQHDPAWPFGNFNYGATGAGLFSPEMLLQEAGRAQVMAGTSKPEWGAPGNKLQPHTASGFAVDHDVDQYWINQGVRCRRRR